MNVQGIMRSDADLDVGPTTWRARVADWVVRRRWLLIVVVAPTLLLASYYYLVASDQYESEAHFIINSGNPTAGSPSSGVGQMLGLSGALSGAQGQVLSVADYLESHDAVNTLREKADLVGIFRRPGTDILSRMWSSNPWPETLLRYYKRQVSVHFDRDSGITTLKVKTFRPEDSYRIAEDLLRLGEARVNEMNHRSYNDAIAMAQEQLTNAEESTRTVQRQITSYRQSGRDIDPAGTGEAQTKLVADLQKDLETGQAQLDAMRGTISSSSPQYVATERRVAALRSRVQQRSAQIAGSGDTIARNLGGYEDIRVRQDFAAKRYEAAAAALEKARLDAQKQQLYLVRVVHPNMPGKALYPERGKIVLTVFFGLLLTYSIGWLIAAGVREHAA